MGFSAGRAKGGLASGLVTALIFAVPAEAQNAPEGPLGPEGTFGAAIPVPSGQEVWWVDASQTEEGPHGLTYRFRFLAPRIGGVGALSPDVALLDLAALCETYVAPRLPGGGAPQPEQVVLSLSDRIVPLGEAVPEAVQYFEAYSVSDGVCEWEFF